MPSLDPAEEFAVLRDRTVEAIRAHFPYKGAKNRLELIDIRVREQAADPGDPHHHDNVTVQRIVKENGGTWAVPITATLRLVRIADNKTLDQSTITLARLPKMTRRLSYIIGGQEKQHEKLFRSKARPYHQTANDGSVVARWNVEKGGPGFSLTIQPDTRKITMGYGDSNIPIMPILVALGVSDDKVREALGDDLYEANKKGRMEELVKIHRTNARTGGADMASYKPPTGEALNAAIRKIFENSKMRPDAMQAAFGIPMTNVTGEGLLLSAKRLVGIVSGREKEDDRQSLSSKDFVGTEDFVAEHLGRVRHEIDMKIRNKIDTATEVKGILSSMVYTGVITSTFDAAQRPEQTNPVVSVTKHLATTIRGPFGGVQGQRVDLSKDQRINPTHLGFLGLIQTPESENTGIALSLPIGVRRQGKDLTARCWNVRTGKHEWVTPGTIEFKNAVFADQVAWKDGKPYPLEPRVTAYASDRETRVIDWKDADYILPPAKASMEIAANLVPLADCNQGNRMVMATKQMEQAISVKHREVPLVQAASDEGTTFDAIMGKFSGHHAPVAGVVSSITKDAIKIQVDGEKKPRTVVLYDHFPLNGGRTMITSTPVVKVGDRVREGQVVADTNFTKGGILALGVNAHVAYMPWKGKNIEDGIVVSESFAKKMTSEHLYTEIIMITEVTVLNVRRWVEYANPTRATQARLAKLDADGVIKVGQKVEQGDVLVAALNPTSLAERDLLDVSKKLARDMRDSALIWDHGHHGTVKRVVRAGNRIAVYVYTEEPLDVGDKLAGRHGNKGIVSIIVPDKDMPHTKDGTPVEMVLNTVGTIGRMNVGQVYETSLGKVAKKIGKPIHVSNFETGQDKAKLVEDLLVKHGFRSDGCEDLIDPQTGAVIKDVHTGFQQTQKLMHIVDKKITARSFGGQYSPHGIPPSGSGVPGGGQKMDQLGLNALLAHGAVHNIREMFTYKSDADQDEVWTAIMTGSPLPKPKPSRVFNHFLDYLRGMGVNVDKEGSRYTLTPMTDAHTLQVSNGALKIPDKMLHAKGIRTLEEAGGLFDPHVTGGLKGKNWSHIVLQNAIPNPIYEGPIRSLLGMKKEEWERLVSEKGMHEGKSGFDIIVDRLKAIDVKAELAKEEASIKTLTGPALQRCYDRVRYLRALKDRGMSAYDAYVNKVLPVIPPALRRIDVNPDGTLIVDDLNPLYRNVAIINEQIRNRSKADNSPVNAHNDRAKLYAAVRSLRAVGMDMSEGGEQKHVMSLKEKMTGMKGQGPKTSFYQDNVVSRRQNASARSTIIPMPELTLDQVGVPQPIAMEIFKAQIVRELHTKIGHTPLEARQLLKNNHPDAVRMCHEVALRTPVLLKRDPVLHKYSIQAFHVKVISGKAIGLHPLIIGGFNADFDGDAMSIFVPLSDSAVQEAAKLRPSQNIFSPTHFGVMPRLSQDGLSGVYQACRMGNPIPKEYGGKTPKELGDLVWQGKVRADATVSYNGRPTSVGRIMLNEALPAALRPHEKLLYDKSFMLDSKGMEAILAVVGMKHQNDFQPTIDRWKDIGNRVAFLNGSSFSNHDFVDLAPIQERVMAEAKKKENAIRANKNLTKEQIDDQVIDVYLAAKKQIQKEGEAHYNSTGQNRIFQDWSKSGAGKGWVQFSQLGAGPVLVTDSTGKIVPVPIRRGFGKGMPWSDYVTHLHGARKGVLDRRKGTSDPGALAKDITNTTIGTAITSQDCGSTEGEWLPLHSNVREREEDLEGRYTAGVQQMPDGRTLQANTLISPELLKSLYASEKNTRIRVRSALHCKDRQGICAMCYGLNESGKHHATGTLIGVIAAQALGEPVTQLSMKTFHTGGSASKDATLIDSYKRVKQLFLVDKNIPGEATLSTVTGVVTEILEDKAVGGWRVSVKPSEGTAAATSHYIPARLAVKVSVGAKIGRGDPLSTGIINPRHLLDLTKDIVRVRSFMAHDLSSTYKEGGGRVRRRNVETVVAAHLNLCEITEAPPGCQWLRGQHVQIREVEGYNDLARKERRPLVKYNPVLRPMTRMPLEMQEDWLAMMNYQRLEQVMVDGSAKGFSSDIAGAHPIARTAHGAYMGVDSARVREMMSMEKDFKLKQPPATTPSSAHSPPAPPAAQAPKPMSHPMGPVLPKRV
jgi:DNA-directed RNA polymerase subunit beta'